jgi:predicted Zn finger-like uncharacterized protein
MEESGPDQVPGSSLEETEMNVTCPNCASVYRVDPAKVPEAGVRARCAVCSAVFAVRREVEGGRPPLQQPTRPEVVQTEPAKAAPVRAEPPKPEAPRVETPKPEPLKAEPVRREPAPAMPAAQPVTPRPSPPSPAAPPSRPAAAPRPAIPGAAPSTPVQPAGAGPARPAAPAAGGAGLGAVKPSVTPAAAAPPAAAPPKAVPGARPPNPFLSQDPALKARRLARALISDMVVYHPTKRQDGLRDGNLKEIFEEEIKKSWEEYAEQVGRDVAESTPYFREALNEILAGGRQIF